MLKKFELKENEILIYFTTHEDECDTLARYLTRNGVEYIESIDIEEMTRLGFTEFPLLVLKNTRQNTYERSWDRKEILMFVAKEIRGIDVPSNKGE